MRWLPVVPNPASSPSGAPVPGGIAAVPRDAVLDGQLPREPSDVELDASDNLTPAADSANGERPRSKRVYFEVFGCQMNKLDAELMLGVLAEGGYELTGDVEEAGVILYNTCAIREQAENRVFSKVSQLKSLKKSRPDTVIGILGCGAQNHQHALFERFPHVGIVCGPGEFLRLPELIDKARDGRQVAALDLAQPVEFERRTNLGPQSHHAYVSVMRGCDMACTYCVVPHTRGPEVSRPVRDIVDEARALVDVGVREITLLGQTVNSYGKRLGRGREIGLQHVLHQLDKIAGLERVRFITSHPRFMNPDLIDAMASLPSVCEYLHLPVQSGSDAVLRRMQRSYSMRHYRNVIDACRERMPDLALATDIIVGFCGETDADFQETVDLMEEMRFHGAFVFRYSERPGTSAAHLADDVPEPIKRERNQILLELQKQVSLEIHSRSVAMEMEVLVEGISKRDKSRWSGRNRQHQIVVFPVEPGMDLVGKLVTVKVSEVTPRVLVGERTGEAR